METLLPCPFCGSKPIVNHFAPHTQVGWFKGWGIPDYPGSCVIECVCGCGLTDATEESVAARWNQRASVVSQDTARLAWLAAPDNTLDNLRAAIDMAMNPATSNDRSNGD